MITKKDSGVRFYVIAQRYPHGLKVSSHSSELERTKVVFKGQFENRREIFPFEFGTALCNVSRYGRISWGLFEPIEGGAK